MDFSNITVLVTGASTGIGESLCDILDSYGATIIGVYNNHKITGKLYDTFKCDIKNEENIKSLFEYVINKHEKIDVVVNGASISLDNDMYDKTKDEFMEVLETNLVGTFLMCKHASLNMHRGVIINISSSNATDTFTTFSMDYDASKAGVSNLTKNLAKRLPNLRICGIEPNWVNTESVLNMNQDYLKKEMERVGQQELLTKEEVALKIIEIILNDDYVSGDIVRMGGTNE